MLQCLKEPTLPFSWTEQNTRWRAGPLASSEVKATPSTFELGGNAIPANISKSAPQQTSHFPTIALFFLGLREPLSRSRSGA
jgi:hypothetical protein